MRMYKEKEVIGAAPRRVVWIELSAGRAGAQTRTSHASNCGGRCPTDPCSNRHPARGASGAQRSHARAHRLVRTRQVREVGTRPPFISCKPGPALTGRPFRARCRTSPDLLHVPLLTGSEEDRSARTHLRMSFRDARPRRPPLSLAPVEPPFYTRMT